MALPHVALDLGLLFPLLAVQSCMSNSGGDMPAHTRCILEEAVLVSRRVASWASARQAFTLQVANCVLKNVAVHEIGTLRQTARPLALIE